MALSTIASQSHQAGIETSVFCAFIVFNTSPNRTKLELKLAIEHVLIFKHKSPNRTKLELKLNSESDNTTPSATPNRTKLELKPYLVTNKFVSTFNSQSHQAGIETNKCWKFNSGGIPPNRTKLELKHVEKFHGYTHRTSPNRTKLELKRKLLELVRFQP